MALDILADTSFVYALIDKDDQNHALARAAFVGSDGSILLPALTLVELAHLLKRGGGTPFVVTGLRFVQQSDMIITDPVAADYDRAADILTKYHDSRIDFVDACIMALAERLAITRVLTYDRRDFGLYRPAHCDFFELLP
jgi:predicted nucleic acid-binding protein